MADYIAKVAKELGISSSKLRYWDKQGLIRIERDGESNYRTFSFQSMMDICEIIFYRSIAMPIESIRTAMDADCHELQHLLAENRKDLEKQIESLNRSIAKIDERLDIISQLPELKARGFWLEKWRCPAVSRFDFSDSALVNLYLEQPRETLALVPGTLPLRITYGVYSRAGEIVRPADEQEKDYLHGLFWICPQKKASNLPEFAAAARQSHRLGGGIVASYLLTAGGTIKTDYYLGRMEVSKTSD